MPRLQVYREWDYVEDNNGVVYCLGRRLDDQMFEAIACYYRCQSSGGKKKKLDAASTYDRLMYHGRTEEIEKLATLPEVVRRSILKRVSSADSCIYLNPQTFTGTDSKYQRVDWWLQDDSESVRNFVASLRIALQSLSSHPSLTTNARVYGGAAFGLVHTAPTIVDDIDILLSTSASELKRYMASHQKAFTWHEVDPDGRLTTYNLMLKAKRWATSQVRLSEPFELSIDLKIARPKAMLSLWSDLPANSQGRRCTLRLEVTDDSEVFCISPALKGVDASGHEYTVLMEGYMYIGCAVNGDIIELAGSLLDNKSTVLVTQNKTDYVIPDLRDVPVLLVQTRT